MTGKGDFLEAYRRSLTSRAWSATPYCLDARNHNERAWRRQILADAELPSILEEESQLGRIPAWAREILNRQISISPPCGHYAFPRPLLQIVDAIKDGACPAFVIGCYAADSERKQLMSCYIYCLDAWLKKAPPEIALIELQMRDTLGKDWEQVLSNVYGTLGDAADSHRSLVVRRLMHRLRWWTKTLVWSDDARNRFQLDVYSGDVRGDHEWGDYGNPPFADPFFAELRLPEVREMTGLIAETVPDGKGFIASIEESWLCAPKVFRYLERLILRMGNINSRERVDTTGSILQCEDTYPDLESYRRWYSDFMSSLTDWLEGRTAGDDLFGENTPVRHWLLRILRLRLRLLEKSGTFGKLTGAQESGKTGGKRIGASLG